MKCISLAVVWSLAVCGAAAACPAWENGGVQVYSTTGEDLGIPNTYSVTAGGNQDLQACGFSYRGYVISSPDFEFSIEGLQGVDRLNIRADAGCDTLLLIHDATGAWHFNDDGGPGINPSVDIMNPVSGTWDVWVGTYGSESCTATLTLEAF